MAGAIVLRMDEHRERAINVMHALAVSGHDFPVNALKRLAALVNGEPMVFADVEFQDSEPRKATATAVLITESRVIRADVQSSPLGLEPSDEASTVTVRAWGRRLLTSLDLDEGSDNTDWAWHHEWDGTWPQRTRARLTYDDGTTLTLPLSSGARGASQMSALLTGLLEDLSKP